MKQSGFVGSGCTISVFGLPVHNPEPSTDRGRRRLAKLNNQQQENRRKSWNKNRTNRQSRYQKMIGSLGLTRGV
jgi:hypothetical protein